MLGGVRDRLVFKDGTILGYGDHPCRFHLSLHVLSNVRLAIPIRTRLEDLASVVGGLASGIADVQRDRTELPLSDRGEFTHVSCFRVDQFEPQMGKCLIVA